MRVALRPETWRGSSCGLDSARCFVLSDAIYRLRYLRTGLAALLVFTAGKMLASEWVHVSAGVSVAVIGAVLLATIAASVWQKSTPVPAH
jgi:predicted tellurium resistance membrane protein TerC